MRKKLTLTSDFTFLRPDFVARSPESGVRKTAKGELDDGNCR